MARPRTRRKERRVVPRGKAHIHSTFNNTLVTLTDPQGSVLVSTSCGMSGLKGSRKGTAFAAQRAAERAEEVRESMRRQGKELERVSSQLGQ